MNHNRYARCIHAVCGVLVIAAGFCATSASAGIRPILVSAENGTYEYALSFTTNGSESFGSGHRVTLYDIAEPGTVISVANIGPLLTLQTQLIGDTPPPLIGATGLVDDPNLLNLVFRYNGIPTDSPFYIENLTITIAGLTNEIRTGIYTSSTSANGQHHVLGEVALPALASTIPEPGSLGLLGLGCVLLARRK